MQELNFKALKNASDEAFRYAIINAVNQLIREVSVGTVHDNKVVADRRETNIEDILISTITAQAEKELLGGTEV